MALIEHDEASPQCWNKRWDFFVVFPRDDLIAQTFWSLGIGCSCILSFWGDQKMEYLLFFKNT